MKMITRKFFALLLAFCLLNGMLPVVASEGTSSCPHEATFEQDENIIPATCTQEGSYDHVTYCRGGCGTELKREPMTIPMVDHVPVERLVEIPASCTAEGVRYLGVFCENCGVEIRRESEETLAKLEHVRVERDVEIPASCKAEGLRYQGVFCENCGVEIERRNEETLAMLEHTPGEPVRENESAATCEAAGSYDTATYCVSCGDVLTRETVTTEALGHDWGEWTITRPATCWADGVETRVCKRDPAHTETSSIAQLTHEWETLEPVDEVKPTCEAAGSYGVLVRCAICGDEPSYTIVTTSPLGHRWSEPRQTKQATCTEKGTVSRTCLNCGGRRDTQVDPLGHDMTYVPPVEPDANGNDGHIGYYACKRCDMLFNDADGQSSVASMESLLVRAKTEGTIQTNGGVVQVNHGVITENTGTIEANHGAITENTGTIEANYGVITENTGSVNHQFYNMTKKMDAGTYSVKYDGSFQCVQTGNGGSNLFLEAGQSGVITLDTVHGSRITKVTYTLNGEELELEDLGDGKYRITVPGTPEGPDGFAFNEGNLRVEIEEDPNAANDGSWKTQNLLNLERQDKSINLLKVMDRDKSMNKNDAAIRVEGMDFNAADNEFREMLAKRSDILNALAEAALTGETGTMIFVLDNGARIICDIERTREVIIDLLPKVQYRPETQDPDEDFEGLLSDLQKDEPKSSSFQQKLDDIEIHYIVKFENESAKIKFEETPAPAPTPQPLVKAEDVKDEPKNKSCVTPDTLITLADGSEKRVDELENTDRLLVWDFDNGCLTDAPMTFFHMMKEEAPVLRVSFSDGTSVGVVEEHVFFDLTDRRFVAIYSAEQEEWLAGHSFAKLVDGQITEVVLSGIREDGVTDSYYSPVSQAHFNCFANGMLNISGFMQGFYNVFDLEENDLKYNAEKKAAELEMVGELPYEIFDDLFPRELFESNNAGWLSVSIAKRMIHLRDLYELFDFCGPFFVGPGSAD